MRRIEETICASPGIRKSALMKATNIGEPEFSKLVGLLDDESTITIHNGLGRNRRGIAYFPAGGEDE